MMKNPFLKKNKPVEQPALYDKTVAAFPHPNTAANEATATAMRAANKETYIMGVDEFKCMVCKKSVTSSMSPVWVKKLYCIHCDIFHKLIGSKS